MKDFFKSVFASVLGTFLAVAIGGFALIALIVSLASSAGSNHESAAVSVRPKSMLVIGGDLTINDTPAHGTPGLDLLLLGGADLNSTCSGRWKQSISPPKTGISSASC